MKINYISYLDPMIHSGGGEMIMRRLLEAGQERGHEIRVSSRDPHQRKMFSDPELTLLCDVFNVPICLYRLDRGLLRGVIRNERYVHMDNAYVDVCNLGYLPCSGHASRICPHKTPLTWKQNLLRRDFGLTCYARRSLVREMYGRSVLNCFLSPLHRDTIQGLVGDSAPSYVVRPLMDASAFRNEGRERDIDNLFVGVFGEAKGALRLKELFSQGEKLTVIGKVLDGVDVSFAEHLGFVDYAKLPEYFNRAKRFIFLPRWPEPLGRVVLEAALCGCELVLNENVGAASFGADMSDPSFYADAEEDFWKRLESLA